MRYQIPQACFVLPALLLGATVVLTGCGDDDGISEKTLPKGTDSIADISGDQSEPGGRGAGEIDAGAADAVQSSAWSVPEGWEAVPGERPMRLATFSVEHGGEQIEVAVSRFPGDVGGELANINRWRRQVGLGPVDAAGLDEIIARFGRSGYPGYRVRLNGQATILIAAAVHEEASDRTWFVKATVPSAEVADRIEPEITAFAKSIGTGGQTQTETK